MAFVKPVMLLVNVPVPEPSVVWLHVITGFCVVLQQIPRAVTMAPPSLVTLPPHVAVVCVMALTPFVVSEGIKTTWVSEAVLKFISAPYTALLLSCLSVA